MRRCLDSKMSCFTFCMRLRTCSPHHICDVAVCCSVLQCVAVCCSVLQCVAVCCSVSQCVAVCCSVLRCVVIRCSVLWCNMRHVCFDGYCSTVQGLLEQNQSSKPCTVLQYPSKQHATCACAPGRHIIFEMLQCVAVHGSLLQCVAVCCGIL